MWGFCDHANAGHQMKVVLPQATHFEVMHMKHAQGWPGAVKILVYAHGPPASLPRASGVHEGEDAPFESFRRVPAQAFEGFPEVIRRGRQDPEFCFACLTESQRRARIQG